MLLKKRLLGLIGSYRKTGNSEIVAKAVARQMGDDWQLSLIRLPKLSVAPCRGCYACLIPGKDCMIEDDLAWLLEQIKQADAVIMAAPNYALGPVGIVKMISDRVLQAAHYFQAFQHIPTAVVLTLGLEKYNGIAQTALCVQTASLGLNARQNGRSLDFHFFDPEFTKEGQMKHMAWLLGKKEEYDIIKDKLKAIRDAYRDGEWEKPGEKP